jgi:type I restriction enzyme R subunit
MPHAYTEDRLVEQPAIGLFAELGWAVAGPPPNAGVAGEPRDAGLLGRETKSEVVLVARLRAALERLNPAFPSETITAAVDELTRDRSAMSLEAANRDVYLLLKEGIKVSVPVADFIARCSVSICPPGIHQSTCLPILRRPAIQEMTTLPPTVLGTQSVW